MCQATLLKKVIKDSDYKVSEEPSNNIELLKVLREKINTSNVIKFQVLPQNISILEAKKNSEEFMKSHFKLHDITCYETISNNYIFGIRLCDPYKLPIEETTKRCSVESIFVILDNDFPKKLYKTIKIQKDITEFTSIILTHEITHTQQETEKSPIKIYTNNEVLPIFLEILHYIEKSSLGKNQMRVIKNRLISLAKNINILGNSLNKKSYFSKFITSDCQDIIQKAEKDIISTSTYIESTIKALNLTDIYQTSNENIRKEIINYIQSIFDGNRSVEDFLNHFDTTFESSLASVQKKLKQSPFI